MKTRKYLFLSILTSFFSLLNVGAWAQTATEQPPSAAIPDIFFNPLLYLAILVGGILAMVFYALMKTINVLRSELALKTSDGSIVAEAAKVKKQSAFHKLMDSLTRTVPVEREKDILLDHNYDGIMELDNQLPPWWKYGFYLTIVFAVVYLFYYHVGSGKLMAAEYKDEMDKASVEKAERMKEEKNNVTDENVAVMIDAHELAEGKSIFETNCVTCHGPQAGGTEIAPNLTDQYWLHGGGIKNVFHIITEGVQGKAMISWKQKLSPRQVNEVASFVLSLQGSNPVGAHPAQGELYTPDGTQSNPDSVKSDSTKAKEKVI